jgi:hypothetical protein
MILRTEILLDKTVEKIRTHFMPNNVFFPLPKSCCLGENVERYGRARQATDDNTLPHVLFSFFINRARNTYSEYVMLFALKQ